MLSSVSAGSTEFKPHETSSPLAPSLMITSCSYCRTCFDEGQLAMADCPSELRTREVTLHPLANAEVIRLFLPVPTDVDGPEGSPWIVHVRPEPANPSGITRGTEDPCSAGA